MKKWRKRIIGISTLIAALFLFLGSHYKEHCTDPNEYMRINRNALQLLKDTFSNSLPSAPLSKLFYQTINYHYEYQAFPLSTPVFEILLDVTYNHYDDFFKEIKRISTSPLTMQMTYDSITYYFITGNISSIYEHLNQSMYDGLFTGIEMVVVDSKNMRIVYYLVNLHDEQEMPRYCKVVYNWLADHLKN